MEHVETLIVGAGISGLAAAAALQGDYLILEADAEIGGYCKTVKQQGFVWDYSGHFFHFKHPEIEQYLRERMRDQRVLRVQKRSFIHYQGQWIDFPFQKNIHQLDKAELIECLHDLYFAGRDQTEPSNFKEMLYTRFGRGISEKFLIPYNEKLYACDLAQLDIDAMGRFFPHASVSEIIRNMREPDNTSYNQTFTYPEGGAIEYVHALARDVDPARIALSETLKSIDLNAHTARTSRRELRYDRLISSEPFMRFVARTGLDYDAQAFSWNKVLVFNLGFDKKGPKDVHWLYFPDRSLSFYRVGFYDNIFGSERMSLYVEIGLPANGLAARDALRKRVLSDLRKVSVISDQALVAEHSVVMDPAYVHITERSNGEVARLKARLAQHQAYSIGRYGSWTYCSIEDNIVEARALASELRGSRGA